MCAYLQRCGERSDAVQAQAPRCAPRPGDALQPRLLSIRIIGLPPGAPAAAEQDNNPQGHARDHGQHIVRQPGQRNKEGAQERNPIEASFRDIYRDGRSLGSRRKLSGSGCCHPGRSVSFTATVGMEQSRPAQIGHVITYLIIQLFYCTTIV